MKDPVRAAFLVALFLLSGSVWGQPKVVRSETYKDIIEKAQNLVLQQDRQQAMTILLNAIRRENSKSAAATELKKNINEISEIFFSDKTQQLYEVAVTLKRTDLNQSQQKISEALRVEGDNFELLLEQVRIALAKGECSTAEEQAAKARLLNPYSEKMNLAYAQATLCQGHMLEYNKVAETAETKKSSLLHFWQILEVERQFKEKNYLKATEQALALRKMDPQYPEAEYWIWKIDQAQKKKNMDAAEKYVMACKNISANLYRQYMMDPSLCRHLSEMDLSGNE